MKKLISKLGEMKQFDYFMMFVGVCGIFYGITQIVQIAKELL